LFFLTDVDDRCDFTIRDARGIRARGRFDHAWRVREEFVLPPDDEEREEALPRKAPQYLDTAVDAERLFLSEVLSTRKEGSFTQMRRDANWQGKPLVIEGKTCDSGIGVAFWRRPSSAVYDIADHGWKRLRATLAIEVNDPGKLSDDQKNYTRLMFFVKGDGKELYRSPHFTWDADKPVEMDVDVAGVRELEIGFDNADDRPHCAASSINWVDIRLEK
jgi:hypothetical protein